LVGHSGGFRVKEEGRRGGRGLVQVARLLINEDRHAERSSPSPMPEGQWGK
jgi:hypothetical protein